MPQPTPLKAPYKTKNEEYELAEHDVKYPKSDKNEPKTNIFLGCVLRVLNKYVPI